MRNFHGDRGHGAFFEGWYLKHQKGGRMLALIPAYHRDAAGRPSASLQVVTGDRAWAADFPASRFRVAGDKFAVAVGESRFTAFGAELNVAAEGLRLTGVLRYGPFTPLEGDIMGPFRFVPGLQCRHGVLSLAHRLEGAVELNGEVWDFTGGTGYIEKDWGRSFPSSYLWTQCGWPGSCVVAAVADVPLGPGRITGCICAVRHGGREYRLATYRGARVEARESGYLRVRQGGDILEAELLGGTGLDLRAPQRGSMTARTIRERPAARVRCDFRRDGKLLFSHVGLGGFERG